MQMLFIYCFLLKPIRDNLAPGFPRAPYLSLSPLHAQKSSGSRLQQTPAITDLYYGHLSLLVPTAQFYCSSKYRYNGHQLAFFSILAEFFQIIVYFFLFFSSSLSLWLKSDHSDSRLT